jgi:hypothetical protein
LFSIDHAVAEELILNKLMWISYIYVTLRKSI